MLILSRRINQELRIGSDIQVKVLHLNSGQVRLGISAPTNVSVHREEIYQKIQQEKVGKQHLK
jgi:carbon storage regulator